MSIASSGDLSLQIPLDNLVMANSVPYRYVTSRVDKTGFPNYRIMSCTWTFSPFLLGKRFSRSVSCNIVLRWTRVAIAASQKSFCSIPANIPCRPLRNKRRAPPTYHFPLVAVVRHMADARLQCLVQYSPPITFIFFCRFSFCAFSVFRS